MARTYTIWRVMLAANRVLNYTSTHGLAAVQSGEVSWPIADDEESKPLLWVRKATLWLERNKAVYVR